MASTTELRNRLDDLEALRDSGVLKSTVDGQTVEFASHAELNQAIHRLKVTLGVTKRRRGTYGVYLGGR